MFRLVCCHNQLIVVQFLWTYLLCITFHGTDQLWYDIRTFVINVVSAILYIFAHVDKLLYKVWKSIELYKLIV